MLVKICPKEFGLEQNFSLEVDKSDIILDLKKEILNKCKFTSIDKLGLYYLTNKKEKVYLNNNTTNIYDYFDMHKEIKNPILYIYDKGIQIDTYLANTIEYSIPIIMIIIFSYFNSIWNDKKKLLCIMSMFHYVKRVFESNYVHIHNKKMELKMLIVEIIYYGLYYACYCQFKIIFDKNLNIKINNKDYIFCLIFFISEINNFHCHLLLRNIRVKSKNTFKIPKGNLFNYIYCANYFWEVCSWVFFSLISGFYCCYIFTLIGFLVMLLWALEKKRKYLAVLNGSKKTKAIIPFII